MTIPVPTQVSISSELVDIVVKNITKVTAQLEWQFSAEVTSVLKAIRVIVIPCIIVCSSVLCTFSG